ncbi:aspartic peptidase domain-containing protein [Mycena sp. CBHHK59/15]|nr:aspartic peptidase domain-containing protein [Mycena sp. CBHHK59/15]
MQAAFNARCCVHALSASTMIIVALSVAILLPVFCTAAEPIHIHMPITRRSARLRTAEDYFSAAEWSRVRYGFSSGVNRTRMGGRATTDNLAVVNQQGDSSYFTTIEIGTPGQTFNVILDTGSSDLFVLDSSCRDCAGSTLFDSSKSSSFSQTGSQATEITYGSGSVAGFVSTDTVSMGTFSVSSQGFLLVEQLTQGLVDGSVSGLIGLAFQSLAETAAAPFWQALINNNQLTSPEMAFQLTRSTSENDEPGGVFTLGGTNSTLFSGDIEFHDLASSSTPTFWMISVSAVTVQGKSVDISTGDSALAAIDTGTTAIGGPTDDVNAIWAAVPGASAVRDASGFFQFPCTTTINITLSFGGNAWPISSEDLNLGPVTQGSSMCVGAIFELTLGGNSGAGNPSWVIGDTFLKNVYSVFRQNPMSVGFAQLSSGSGSSTTSSSGAPSSASASLPHAPPIPSSPSQSGSPSTSSNDGRSVMVPITFLLSFITSLLAAIL